MHIQDVFQRDATTLSIEFFPPRTDAAWDALFNRIAEFESLRPSYVSVTYGAGGSTRERTHDLVDRLNKETELDAHPHLTCVMQSEGEVRDILRRYADSGVNNIMALRGDPPAGAAHHAWENESFQYAADLVRFIRAFNDEGNHPDKRGFGIGVAGFPEGHPDTRNSLIGMDHLKAKVDCGADYVCSQMFFDNAMFYDWCERCEIAGITVPLVAGIMPITSLKTMHRMAQLAEGTRFPAPLQRALKRAQDDPEAVRRVGIHWATEQCRDLIERGVRGIHFYTLNQSDATQQIYETLGVKNSIPFREPTT